MITPCRKKVNLLQSAASRKINSLNYLKQRREGTLLGGWRTTTSSGPGSQPPVIPFHCLCMNFISNSLQSILSNAYFVTSFRSLSPFRFSFLLLLFTPTWLDLYSGGYPFKSRPKHQITCLIFLILSKRMPQKFATAVCYDNLRYGNTNSFHSRLHFPFSSYSIIKLLAIKLLQGAVFVLEADSHSGDQDYSGLKCNRKLHYRIQKRPKFEATLIQK
jgi:hypothetical protein